MSQEWVSILALVALFVLGTVLPINMGALAFVAAWFVGMFSLDLTEKEIIGGMSGDLVLTLIGVTYLFAIAKNNGTVDLIVRAAVRAVGGRVALIPWAMFLIAAVLTAMGAASPAACAIIGPIALGFAGRYKINPLMMGMFVVHGAQGGGFSPISIYGTITNGVMADADLPGGEITIFLASLVFNLAIAAVLFVVLGGRELLGRRIDPEDQAGESDLPSGGARVAVGRGTGTGNGGMLAAIAERPAVAVTTRVATDQLVTLLAFVAVAVVALGLGRNIGFTAITAAVALTALYPTAQKDAIRQVAWGTVVLVAGVSVFAAILETAGVPTYVGTWAAGFTSVLLGALILLYVGGIVSAFASSTALLPIIIPIAVPLIAAGEIGAVGLVAGLAVASTIVDVSPFSTNGALMVANRPDTITEERFYKQVLIYSAVVVAVGPLLVWAALVVPGWF